MSDELIRLDDLRRTDVAIAGGKAANLGELTRLAGVRVPPGFVVSTDVFRRLLTAAPIRDLIDRLCAVQSDDQRGLLDLGARVRTAIEQAPIADDLMSTILAAVATSGDDRAWAVRSSATAEDLPTMSFAGQHDTFLDVRPEDIADRVRRCWASLYSERAVTYRERHGIDHRDVAMAVLLQPMVTPNASGVMFTADPTTFDRTVVAIEAVAGVGEALVSGQVNPDVFTVHRDGTVDRVQADAGAASLTDREVVGLAALGRRIEAHFGGPQDIEWCLVGDDVEVVQSRPITTLFPIPAAPDDVYRVYVSVGHQQMMTDAMKPLGLSLWMMTSPAPMVEAASRLFVDVTAHLSTPSSRDGLLDVLGKSDPLLRDALQTVLDRTDRLPTLPDDPAGPPVSAQPPAITVDPTIVAELIAGSERSVAACARDIANISGSSVFDFILDDIAELRRLLFDPLSHQVFTAAMDATWWLNEHVLAWLGEKNVADALTQSVPNNVTSEMGLALLDVADVVRAHPDAIAVLRAVDHDRRGDAFLAQLDDVDGGVAVRAALEGFLERYGMRGAGEIDITRPRWSERPSMLVPVILSHVDHMEPGEAARRFEQGQRDASARERDILQRLRALPDGERKATETKAKIDCVRTFIGYREYPKYAMVSRYLIYKRALLAEAERLVSMGVLREPDDVFFLRFDEFHEAVRTNRVDHRLIDERRIAFTSHESLVAPRVLTSDGEARSGRYRRDDVPDDALAGLAVSAGVVEGRARIVHDIADADLEPGDILVTSYTDPSWTPLFVSIAGLVTEVGGTMTHGAVIAREYGLPAVVAVERATQRIADGQRIRVDGTDGSVTLLTS